MVSEAQWLRNTIIVLVDSKDDIHVIHFALNVHEIDEFHFIN